MQLRLLIAALNTECHFKRALRSLHYTHINWQVLLFTERFQSTLTSLEIVNIEKEKSEINYNGMHLVEIGKNKWRKTSSILFGTRPTRNVVPKLNCQDDITPMVITNVCNKIFSSLHNIILNSFWLLLVLRRLLQARQLSICKKRYCEDGMFTLWVGLQLSSLSSPSFTKITLLGVEDILSRSCTKSSN